MGTPADSLAILLELLGIESAKHALFGIGCKECNYKPLGCYNCHYG